MHGASGEAYAKRSAYQQASPNIPATDAGFRDWLENFSTMISADPGKYGLDARCGRVPDLPPFRCEDDVLSNLRQCAYGL